MLRWALGLLVIALIATLFGAGGVAAATTGIARTLFYLFVVAVLATVAMGLAADQRPLP